MSVVRNNGDSDGVPPRTARARVEIAMLEIITQLHQEGLSVEEIALSLADASEDYVILLAKEKIFTH